MATTALILYYKTYSKNPFIVYDNKNNNATNTILNLYVFPANKRVFI